MPDNGPFKDFLGSISKVAAALGVAIAALLPLVLPDRLIPEQLGLLRSGLSVTVLIALFFAWSKRSGIAARRGRYLAVGFVALVLLLMLQMWVVQPVSAGVDSESGETEERVYLVGFALTASGREILGRVGGLDEPRGEQIERGGGPQMIPTLFGGWYYLAASLYIAASLILAGALVLAISGTVLDEGTAKAERAEKPSEPSGGEEPAGAGGSE